MITIKMEGDGVSSMTVSVDEKKPQLRRDYSKETFCSESSNGVRSKCKSAGNMLRKRQILQPLLGSSSPYRSTNSMSRLIPLQVKDSMNSSAQKIISARMLRVKQLQNELSETQLQLSELAAENRALHTLQKRQEVLLKRYESKQAALPQIMHSYEEEVRILSSRLKQARAQIRTLEERLRTRDNELSSLRDKCHHLEELSQSKNLRQRAQLQQRLELLQDQLREKEKNIQLLTRKVMLEGKNYKHQLATETARHKAARNELAGAMEKISQLEIQLKKKDKFIASSMPRPVSLLSLHPSCRLQSFQRQAGTAFEQVNHSDQVLEEEEEEDEEEPDDEKENCQDYSESSYTDQHTNTSQMSSLENEKEVSQVNPSNVSMSLDYQTKRFQFSNRNRQNGNIVHETTCIESVSDQSIKSLSQDQPELESDLHLKSTKGHKMTSDIVNISNSPMEQNSECRTNSEMKVLDQNVKECFQEKETTGRDDEFLSSLVLNIEKEENLHDTFGTAEVVDFDSETKEPSTEISNENGKTGQDIIQLVHSRQCVMLDDADQHLSKNCSHIINNYKKDEKEDKSSVHRRSVIDLCSNLSKTDDTNQQFQEVELKIKSESTNIKSELKKGSVKLKCGNDSKKKALLETMNVIDNENREPFKNKQSSTISSSLFVGSVREPSTTSNPFISQQHVKTKTQLMDTLFHTTTSDILVDPGADGTKPKGFQRK